MSKFSTIAFVSLASLAMAGCSSLNVFDGRHFWSSDADSIEIVTDSDQLKESDLVDEEPEKALSEYTTESFPEWMSTKDPQDENWTILYLKRGQSFGLSLIQNGISVDWLRDLKRSDFIKLSTIYDGQPVWLSKNKRGELTSLYTSPKNNVWYYIEITNRRPLMRENIDPVDRITNVSLTPETKTKDLSEFQKSAVSVFIRKIQPSLNHDMTVMLSKGLVDIEYRYTQISENQLGGVKVLGATAKFEDHIMTYVSE